MIFSVGVVYEVWMITKKKLRPFKEYSRDFKNILQ